MFKVLEVEDSVRVPPEMFEMELEESIGESLQEKFGGFFSPDLGIVLNLESVEEIGEGKMVPEDGGVFYPARFRLLIFMPEEHEVVHGEVVDITEFGAFVRIGPVDAMTHISQIMNDYVSYDKKNSTLVGRDRKNTLKEGDMVRARVISISFTKDNRVGLTMRQPGLGALKWFEGREEEPAKPKPKEPPKPHSREEVKEPEKPESPKEPEKPKEVKPVEKETKPEKAEPKPDEKKVAPKEPAKEEKKPEKTEKTEEKHD